MERKVKVWKSSNNKVDYRTPLSELDGLPEDPQEGKRLLITSSTFESGGIVTSIVEFVEKQPNGYIVKTENSTYHIEFI
jgi:hypothetical protein